MRIFARCRRQTGRFARAAEDCQPRGPQAHNGGQAVSRSKARAGARISNNPAALRAKSARLRQYQARYLRNAAMISVPTAAAR